MLILRMDEIKEFSDERNKTWCIHCGGGLAALEINRDHVPSKCLLSKPYPRNLPLVLICKSCNEGFSLDEEYLTTFLSCVLAGSTAPKDQQNPRTARILERNVKLKRQIEQAKRSYETRDGDTRILWKPETERIRRIVLKNARGHAYFEYGEPMLEEPNYVWFSTLESLSEKERAKFESVDDADGLSVFPEVGSRMMTRVLTGQDLLEGWVVIQDGIYRYSVAQHDTMLVRSVLFEYLATEVYWND